MVRNIVGRVYSNINSKPLGTCFSVSEKYVFTARHILEDKVTKILEEYVKCEFHYKNQSAYGRLIYEDKENDFAILEIENNFEGEIYRISKYIIERKDEWTSFGYPANTIAGLGFSGYVNEKRDDNRYEVYIHNQDGSGGWNGASGSPIVIEDEIAGIVLEQESGGNIKTRLEIVSMESITDKLQLYNPEILDAIEMGYHPKLKERLKCLSNDCKELFYIDTSFKDRNIFKYHVFIDNDDSIAHLANVIRSYIHDYGVELILDEQYGKARGREKIREIEYKIDCKKLHILELIKNEYQLVHILLWILIEGELGYPRIGSYILDKGNNIPRDIYINDTNGDISIIIGNGYLDKSIIGLFRNCVNEINDYIEKNKKNIVIKDKLVIESLSYSTQNKIKTSIFHNIGQEGISISIAILIGFDYKDVFRCELCNEEKIEYLKDHVNSYENEFMDIVQESELINNIEINWFFIPFNDVSEFNNNFKNKYLKGVRTW
jgi:hypothetical protein